MIWKLFILLGAALSATASFDYIRDSFRFLDENTDPCENFYRHACPRNDRIQELRIQHSYKNVLDRLTAKQYDKSWENMGIYTVLKNAHGNEYPEISRLIVDIFESKCIEDSDKTSFLEYVQTYLNGDHQCRYTRCLVPLAADGNCTRAAENLYEKINRQMGGPIQFHIKGALDVVEEIKDILEGASAIVDGDLREGVEKVRLLVETMIAIVDSWIEKTPWAVNHQAVSAIKTEIKQLHLYDNYAISLRNSLDYLFRLEQNYLLCVNDIGLSEEETLFCAIAADRKTELPFLEGGFSNEFGASNWHPFVQFSYYFYDMAQNVEEFAAVLGGVGQVVGHEVSHTLIENPNSLDLIPFFSNESFQCVTNQFKRTCDTYKEDACYIGEHQIDESGSDILGRQLAYSIFEEYYADNMHDEYLALNSRSITFQQLFFYAYAFTTCEPAFGTDFPGAEHPPFYIRTNAIAQHPGFQEAFQCSPDSKMMQSVTEECIIFGEDAPENKRHKFHAK